MEKQLFDIDPAPSFWATVSIPCAGDDTATVKMQFVYLDRDEYVEFWKTHDGKTDTEVLPLIVQGWDGFKVPFSLEALARLLVKRQRSGRAILDTWRNELFGAAEKN